jgi:putative ABC transport system permease protein
MLQDLRYGLRMLRRSPGFTTVAGLSLALAISSITVIFAAVDLVLVRPLPYQHPEQLVAVWERDLTVKTGSQRGVSPAGLLPLSVPNFKDFRALCTSFSGLAGYFPWNATISDGVKPQRVRAAVVSADLFSLLGVQPLLGRGFLSSDGQKGHDRVVVLSHGLWQSWRGGDPRVLGQKIHVEGEEFEIVGVMPRGFDFPNGEQLWRPLVLPNIARNFNFLKAIARLKEGADLRAAQAEMDTLTARFAQVYPESRNRGAWLTPWRHQLAGKLRPALLVLFAAVGFLLLLACANVSNLLLARAVARGEEIAIRLAMGVGRDRLIRQFLTEGLLLGALGAGLGALFGFWGFRALVPLLQSQIPHLEGARLDARVLLFTVGASLATVLLFGLAPALHAANAAHAAHTGRRGGRSGLGASLLQLTVVFQVVVALTLGIGAGLLAKSFARLLAVDLGFRPERLLTMELNLLPPRKYTAVSKNAATFEDLIGRISRLPGVAAVGVTWGLPLTHRAGTTEVEIEGRVKKSGETDDVTVQTASPDLFRTLGLPLREGRTFTDHDDAGSPGVVIVNEEMARRYWQGGPGWPSRSPLGRRITFAVDFGSAGKLEKGTREVVGVVGNVHDQGLDQSVQPELYFPLYQSAWRWVHIAVRTAGENPTGLAAAIAEQVRQVDGDLALANVETAEQLVADSLLEQRLSAWLLGFFAAAALILASLGIYGTISYLVVQRTREIGIRIALGASRASVLRLTLARALLLALAGALIGVGAATALTRLLKSILYEVSPLDASIFAALTALLVVVALAASYLPARRATRVDPVAALRME